MEQKGERGLPVKCNEQGVVQIIALRVPSSVQKHGNKQRRQYLPILQDPKWQHRVPSDLQFPKHKQRQSNHKPNHQRGDDPRCPPDTRDTASEGEGEQDEGKDGGKEEETDEVDLPEDIGPHVSVTESTERRGDFSEETLPVGSPFGLDKGKQEGDDRDGENDGPHTCSINNTLAS